MATRATAAVPELGGAIVPIITSYCPLLGRPSLFAGKISLDGTGPVKLNGISVDALIGRSGIVSEDLMCRK